MEFTISACMAMGDMDVFDKVANPQKNIRGLREFSLAAEQLNTHRETMREPVAESLKLIGGNMAPHSVWLRIRSSLYNSGV